MTDPIATKLDDTDGDWLLLICKRSGLKRSVVIRRAIRVLAEEAVKNPAWNWVAETSQPLPPLPPELAAELRGDGGSETERQREQLLALAEQRKKEAREATAAAAALGAPPKDFADANRRARDSSEAGRRSGPRKTRS